MAPAPTLDLFTAIAVVAIALYTLVTASQRAVSGALVLAAHFRVPEVVIGMTVLAVGTSLPEIGAHVVASLGILSGQLDYEVASAVVLGGNLGSSTLQQTLLVGVLLLAIGRMDVPNSFLRLSYIPMVAALAGTFLLALDGRLSTLDGLLLLGGYLAYSTYGYAARPHEPVSESVVTAHVHREILLTVGALGLVVASASVLLWVIEFVVATLVLSGSMVGVVTIGLAAALPELSTVLDAVRRRTPNVALGVLIGSNVVNSLLGIGLGAAISTYAVPPAVIFWDLPFKLLVAVALLAFLRVGPDRALTRREGAYLVVAYFAFVSGRLLLFATG